MFMLQAMFEALSVKKRDEFNKGGLTIKILWVTNLVIGAMHMKKFGRASNGFWMDALLKDFYVRGGHDLVIATTGRNEDIVFLHEGIAKYYILPGGNPNEYDHKNSKNTGEWEALFAKEKPDIIQIWGTEYKHGLAAVKAANGIPCIIYMQGILEAVARYYEAGIEHKDLIKTMTLWDLTKRNSILAAKRRYIQNAKYEKEMLILSGNIISENIWCNAHCKAIAPEVKTYYCPLSINRDFDEKAWTEVAMEPHTILVNSSGYPLKGLHMVIRAVHLVKKKYPDVRLFVPGSPMKAGKDLKSRIRKTGYVNYIEKLTDALEMRGNIIYIGIISAAEMAEKMAKVNVFVLGSALENHSSTLKEAMQVGTPCVASIVGGVPEYAVHGENALLYRFEEYELLAENIMNIFENPELAKKLSTNARRTIGSLNENITIYDRIISIYEKVIACSGVQAITTE